MQKDIINSLTDKGDTALFGKSTQDMKAQWKVPDRRSLADFAPTIILKAKDFAAEITIFNAQQNQMRTEPEISSEHIAVFGAKRTGYNGGKRGKQNGKTIFRGFTNTSS